MKLEKLAPWNWFKNEEEQAGSTLPVRRSESAVRHQDPLLAAHEEIDRLFDSFARGLGFPSLRFGHQLAPSLGAVWLKPSLDLSSTEKEYTVTVELPGVEQEDVTLQLEGDTLVIRGEKKHEEKESKKDFYRVERSYGSFQRTLSLPQDADQDGIQAKFDKGVLTLTIPRRSDAPRLSRSIEIGQG